MSRTGLLGASLVLATLAACTVVLLAASGKPAEAAFPGKNGEIVFGNSGIISAVRSDGGGLRPLTPEWHDGLPGFLPGMGMYYAWAPQWSPGGKYFLFPAENDMWHESEVYLARADGSGIAMLTGTRETAYESFPQWYPSGRRIAYCAAPTQEEYGEIWISGDYEIYSLRLDRNKRPIGPPVRLTDNDANDCPHSVNPDGEKMAFASDREGYDEVYGAPSGDDEVYVVGAAGPEGPSNPATRLTDNATSNGATPDWSPNGKKIAYAGIGDETNPSKTDVFVMRADGTAKRNLTESVEVSETGPAWSPNSARIAFAKYDTSAEPDERGGIWKMRADGTDETRVTSGYIASDPDWRPIP